MQLTTILIYSFAVIVVGALLICASLIIESVRYMRRARITRQRVMASNVNRGDRHDECR